MTQTNTISLAQTITDIVDEQAGPLRGFILSRIGSPTETEDLLQEIWLQLSKTLTEQSLDNPRAWLYRVARNKIIDHYRRQPVGWLEEYLLSDEGTDYEDDELFVEEEAAEQLLFQEQFWEELYEALDELPAKQRTVFVRNEIEGITLREIAEQGDENLKTIISRKRYAVLHLRERLRFLFEDWIGELD